jgi:hypothetical protein
MDEAPDVSVHRHEEQLARRCSDHGEGRLDSRNRSGEASWSHPASLSPYTAAQLPDPLAGGRRRSPDDPDVAGHAKLANTTVYLHLSRRHLQSVASPLEAN